MSAAPDILANMARGWNRDPAGVAFGTEWSGVSAALWSHEQDDVQEVWAEPDETRHIIAIPQSRFRGDMFFDGRLAWSQIVQPGTCTFVVSGQRPRAIHSTRFSVLHLYLPRRLLESAVRESSLSQGVPELIDPGCQRPDPVMRRIGREVLSEMSRGEPLSRLRVDSFGLELCVHLLRRHSNLTGTRAWGRAEPARGGLAPWQVRRVQDYLAAHLADDPSLAELAELAQLSPAHFCRAYKQAVGRSPLQSLTDLRIERAKALMADPRLGLAEVALAVGYANQSAFGTAFRKVVGVSPGEWRKRAMS